MSTPSGTDRLLSMLNSATSPPPPSISSPLHPNQARQSGSPREPSPTPPPASLQSINDLFASIMQPKASIPDSPSQAKMNQTSPQPQSQPQDRASKLLGMLNTTVSNSSPSPSSSSQSMGAAALAALTTGFNAESRESSAPSSRVNSSRGDARQPSRGVPSEPVKSPPIPLSEPVISHSSASPPLPGLSGERTPATVPEPVVSPPPHSSRSPTMQSNTSSPATATIPPPSAAGSTPKKSMFDFVSPFAAFDAKPASPAKTPSVATPSKAETKKDVNGSTSTPNKAISPPVSNPDQSSKSSQLPLPDHRARLPSSSNLDGKASGAGKEAASPYLVSQVVEKGVHGKGPKKLSKESINIDLSLPNLDGLMNAPGTVQITPTTIMKSDNVAFQPGRNVGVSSTWLAYTLSRGRVRLIDKAYGARLVLQLPTRSANGAIIDLAVTQTLVAVVAADHSVTVFKVPQSWSKDDPPCEMLAYILPASTSSLGNVHRVEWINRPDSSAWLAIGGYSGVVVVDIATLKDRDVVSMADLAKENKILETEGTVVSFCLNATHQVLGILSDQSYLTLYNMANSARVWHRQLPSNLASSPPSSIQFIESNVIVGRNNDTTFELVQITIDTAVLSTISFDIPALPSTLHFAHSVYDPIRTIFWVAPFARGSLYGFKYNLKGIRPAKVAELPASFDQFAEYPLDSVTGMVLGQSGEEENLEVFFSTPNGFSQAHIEKSACDTLMKPSQAQPEATNTPAATEAPKAVNKEEPVKKAAPIKQEVKGNGVGTRTPVKQGKSPAIPQAVLSDGEKEAKATPSKKRELDEPKISSNVDSIGNEDLNKALRRTESLLQNNFKQILTNSINPLSARVDSMGTDLAAEISSKVEKQVKASLGSLIQQEIKKSVLPSLSSIVQAEVRTGISTTIPATLSASLQNMPRDLERSLAPSIQRMVANVVQSSVDRSIENLTATLVPSMEAANSRLSQQLQTDFRSEMVQIRKDFSPPTDTQEPLLRSMSNTITDLQRQITSLSEQIARRPIPGPSNVGAAPPAPVPMPIPVGPPSMQQARQPEQSTSSPRQNASQLEDAFLSALSVQSVGSTVQLVNEYWSRTEGVLPNLPAKSPLSQAILLTLLHRLAIALSELPPFDPVYPKLCSWSNRVSYLVDPRSPDIATYYPRVMPVVESILGNTLETLGRRYGMEPPVQEIQRSLRHVMSVIRAE